MTNFKSHSSNRGFSLVLVVLSGIAISLLVSACSGHSEAREGAPVPVRPWAEVAQGDRAGDSVYELAKQIGTITDQKLGEVSGIAAGHRNPGVWWVHNDSGDDANVYALDQRGKLLTTFSVSGAKNVDWEDIGSGPGRDGRPALYLADTGDNGRVRAELVIYRVPEPAVNKHEPTGSTETAEAFPFIYPDGKHDAEAIFVDQQSGRIYIVTKLRNGGCGVYRFPLPLEPGRQVTLERVKGRAVSDIEKLPLVTGAATSPDNNRVVIRTYFNALELQRAKGGAFETIFNAAPTAVSIPLERQGEAIAYTADGEAIVTTSEKVPAPIYQMTRQ